MRSDLSELQAKQIIQLVNRLREQVEHLAFQAKLVNRPSFDALVMLQESGNLMVSLMANWKDFETATAHGGTLSRTLPSRPPAGGGMPPAAQWVPQLRASYEQFGSAVRKADAAIRQLHDTAKLQMDSPGRTATPADNLFEMALVWTDLVSKYVESRKREAS